MWGKTSDSGVKPLNFTPGQTLAPNPTAAFDRKQAPATPPRQTASLQTASLGKETKVKGDIYSEEDLYFDGNIEGSLEVRGVLTIGPNGKVKANVKAKELVVKGSIHGDVEASDRISIMNGATIVGDVKTAGIVIEDGAYFKGGIDILRPETAKKTEMVSAAAAKA